MVRRILVSSLVAALAAVAVPLGSAQASPSLSGPSSAAFGSVEAGTSATQTLTFTAGGAVTVTDAAITQVGTPDPDFFVDSDGCTGVALTTGQTCTITVGYLPFAKGPVSGKLTLTDGSGLTEVALSGTGATTSGGTYFRSPAKRLLDTRYMGTKKPLGAKAATTVQITGANGVPASGVTAVVVNLTATKPTASSFLTVYPNGRPRPNASAMTFPKGFTGANLVTVPVGTGGKIAVYNNAGATHVIVDLVGYYVNDSATKGSDYSTVQPERIFDSRRAGGPYRNGSAKAVPDLFGDPTVTAYAVNLTAVTPTSGGYFTAMNTQPTGAAPATSTLTYTAGQTVANMAIVPVNGNGDFWVRNTQAPGGTVHMLIDVVGYYYDDPQFATGLRYRAINPTRVLDSRNHIGLSGAWGTNQTRNLQVSSSIATSSTFALVSNVTAVAPTTNTYLTLWGAGFEKPGVSNLNLNARTTRANAAVPEVSGDRRVSIFNRIGSVNVILDVTGAFDFPGGGSGRQMTNRSLVEKRMAHRSAGHLAHAVR